MSRVARGLSLVAGGAVSAQIRPAERRPGDSLGEQWILPQPQQSTLSEIFAAHPRDGGWAGFLLAHIDPQKPILWVQDRMAIIESGRVHPPGLPAPNLVHVEARDAKDALWAMEEGVRCSALSCVIGEIWGDPRVVDFTATRRLAVASEKSGTPCWLVRLGGTANLSGARMRWRVASARSLPNWLDPRAPGVAAWDAELFRARGFPTGRWTLAHEGHPSKYYFDGTREAGRFHVVAEPRGRTLGEGQRLTA